MPMKEIRKLTARQLAVKIKQREISVTEAAKAALEQIHQAEPALGSFVTVDEAGALQQAAEVQKKIDAGELAGPLAGVPAAIKDNLCT